MTAIQVAHPASAQGLNDIVRNPNNAMNPSDAQRGSDQARREDREIAEDRGERILPLSEFAAEIIARWPRHTSSQFVFSEKPD